MTLAAEQEGQQGEAQAHSSEDQRRDPAVELHRLEFPGDLVPDSFIAEEVLLEGVEKRGEPVRPEVLTGGHAEGEGTDDTGEDGFHHHAGEVQHHIEHRQRGNMAHQLGDEHGQAVVEEVDQGRGGEEGPRCREAVGALERGYQNGQQGYDRRRDQMKQQSREIAGQKLRFPPQGQRAIVVGGSGVVEIGEEKPGHQQAVAEDQYRAHLRNDEEIFCGLPAVHPKERQQMQRQQQQAAQGPEAPQRRAPQERPPEQAGVTAGYP